MRNTRGFTLTELLIAIAVFLVVLVASLGSLTFQSRAFSRGTDESGMLQNLRYGIEQLEQDLRMAGANAPDRQAPVVYAGPNTFSFNADNVSNIVGDIAAVYVDPDAPAGEVAAWPLASATVIPGSAPAFTYPLVDMAPSQAETITYWFTADNETARGDDFILVRRVNDRPQETLVRSVLAPAVGPFFKYWYLNAPIGVAPSVDSVPTAWGTLAHTAPQHGLLPDTGMLARIDLLRSVEARFRVTNQRAGAAERWRSISTTIPLPNVGVKKLQTCGDGPIFGSVVTAVLDVAGPVPEIDVTWAASVDEAAGELDIIRYVIWRRANGVVSWGDPFAAIPSGGPPPYTLSDPDVESGSTYQYAVSAQDCTPLLSTRRTSGFVFIP